MRENLDPWSFVIASYVLCIAGTLLMVGWAWLGMRRAESRRERSRSE